MILALLLLCALLIVFLFGRGHELEYHGKNIPVLCCDLAYGSPEQRRDAEAGIRYFNKAAVPDLLRLLDTTDFGLRARAWRLLPRLSPGMARTVAGRIKPPNYTSTVRLGALRALRLLGPETVEANSRKISLLLDDGDEIVAREGAKTLGILGEEGLDLLLPLSKHSSARVRHKAALALSGMSPVPAGAERTLAEMLDDSDEQVRLAAALGLANRGPLALPVILEKLRSTNDQTRIAGVKALVWMPASQRRAVPALLELLEGPSPVARAEALTGLMRLSSQDERVRDAINHSLEDEDVVVRTAATNALTVLQ